MLTFGAVVGLTAEAWVALGTWATVLVAVVAGVVALQQVREARRTREEQAQPYVVVFMEPNEATPQIIDLVVRNFGNTAARDVTVRFSPPLQRSVEGGSVEDVWFFDRLPVLVPGQEWRTLWDFGPSRAATELPDRYDAVVKYTWSHGPLPPLTYTLDWTAYKGRRWVTVYGVHDVAKALREMDRTIRRWTEGLRGLSVFVRDADARDAQLAEELAARRASGPTDQDVDQAIEERLRASEGSEVERPTGEASADDGGQPNA